MADVLLELARHAAKVATHSGASDARTMVFRTREVRVEWRDGKLDRIRESTRRSLNVSLYVDGRYSDSSTSDLRPEALDGFVEQAVASTRHLARDEHRRLAPPERYRGLVGRDLEIHDAGVDAVTPEDRLGLARRLEEAARAAEGADRLVSVTASVSDSESEGIGFATNGLEANETSSSFSQVVTATVRDDDDRRPNGYSYATARFAADLPSEAELGREAVRRALDQLGSRQVPTGRYVVVIENRTVPRLAWHLLGPLQGAAVQQKRSFLEGRIGQPVGSELLDVTDDPHLVRGLGSTAWDGEGMTTTPRQVFDRGVLRTFFLDTYYASKLGQEPTSGSFSNLVWRTGERDAAAMVGRMDEGLLVSDFLGGNSNRTTGDFSFGIKGYWVKDGALVHPVSEMNIAGNHLELWKSLAELGSDPWRYSSMRAPSLRFEGVQCSGSAT